MATTGMGVIRLDALALAVLIVEASALRIIEVHDRGTP